MSNPQLFTIKPLPGRGFGVVANDKIPQGTRIISEAPLFIVPRNSDDHDSIRDGIARDLKGLGCDQQRSYFSLSNALKGDPILNIARTNALPLGSVTDQSAIFLQSSRINHSCKPNALNTWNSGIGQMTIHAICDIQEGDEVTISYLNNRPGFEQRRWLLEQSFHFDCVCELCSAPLAQRKESDKRRARIAVLDEAIGDVNSVISKPLSSLGKAHELLGLFQAEGISGPDESRLYYDAFQIAITHSDQARAKIFAQRASLQRVVCEGADGTEVARLNNLADNPASHILYGTSNKWTSAISDIPDSLKVQDFEDWLWRKKKWAKG